MSSALRFAFAAFILVATAPWHLYAQQFQIPEKPQGHVNDYAGVLEKSDAIQLEELLRQLENKTGHQVAVAIFKTVDGNPIDDVANRLFERWQLGSKDRNDGVLLIIAVEERAIRIEVGYGLEGQIPDALAGRIVQHDLIPSLKQGNYSQGILVFITRLNRIFSGDQTAGLSPVRDSRKVSPGLFALWLVLIVIVTALGRSHRYERTLGGGGVYRRRRGSPTHWGSGWGGGSSGGFGGWGGGGGLSGGGGASGRW